MYRLIYPINYAQRHMQEDTHAPTTPRIRHVHLVSDSTGETVSSVFRAAMAQFEGADVQEHIWSLVRSNAQLERVFQGLEESPGVVMYTLVDMQMRARIRKECQKRRLPSIPVLGPVIRELSNFFGQEATSEPGTQHGMNEDYFSRVDAIEYALAHDDGQGHWNLEEADIVIVGPSRTSKSPTCVYLAHRGYKAANVPFVKECPLPDNLLTLKLPTVVGLTVDPDRLIQIRRSRLDALEEQRETNYVSDDAVREEIAEARKLYRKQGWPVIDVSRRSVEETAALIIQYREKHKDSQKRTG